MATALMNTPPIAGICGAGDLTGKEGYWVKPGAAGWVLAGLGERGWPLVIGGAAGQAIAIATIGSIVKQVAGVAIAIGANVKCDANGKTAVAVASAVASTAVTGSNVLGVALSATANANEIVEVLYEPVGAVVTTAA